MMSKAAEEAIYAMELYMYNNTLLPVINSILQTKHNKVKKLAVMTSGLVDEVITTLNAKSYPLVSEFISIITSKQRSKEKFKTCNDSCIMVI